MSEGTLSCTGAIEVPETHRSRVDGALSITLTMTAPGVYHLCHSTRAAPTLDEHFTPVDVRLIVVVDPSPPPSPPPTAAYDNTWLVALVVCMAVVVVALWCAPRRVVGDAWR